jgi:hypothetical protein
MAILRTTDPDLTSSCHQPFPQLHRPVLPLTRTECTVAPASCHSRRGVEILQVIEPSKRTRGRFVLSRDTSHPYPSRHPPCKVPNYVNGCGSATRVPRTSLRNRRCEPAALKETGIFWQINGFSPRWASRSGMRLGGLHTALLLLAVCRFETVSSGSEKYTPTQWRNEISANLLERSLPDRTAKDRGSSVDNSPKVSSSER